MAKRLSTVVVGLIVLLVAVGTTSAGTAKTLKFTALFVPGGRIVAHPPAGEPGNETFVNLTLVGGQIGTGTVHTTAAKDGRSTRYVFAFRLRTGTIGLIGRITATSSGETTQAFTVSGGTGAYKGARGTGSIGKRPGGLAGIAVTIQLR